MPSIMKTASLVVAGLAAVATALPAGPRLNGNQMKLYELSRRQNAAAAAAGLTDVDILQFALTLELLEAAFYQQGFAKFPQSDFQSLGLTPQQITDLQGVGTSEQTHVSLLQGAIAQAGVKPVQACEYNFGFTDAKGMVGTASVLESVGVSAYLGAAPLITDGSILGTAGSILSIEARHQTFIRVASQLAASPSAFDTALSPKQVFSLAAPFIKSCPEGSNLAIQAFPGLAMAQGAQVSALASGQTLNLQATGGQAAGSQAAQFCGFTNGQIVGGTSFSPFVAGTGCVIPQNLQGVVYVTLTNSAPLTGKLTDAEIMAGPMVVQIS
ncbi:hypothetical protein RB594_002217 [Gaeumannomyces avenae]